ncbi:MAG: N-acetylmuramoyl-L-alanine amidase [Bacteroidaceae bacterium]|nr:N-acetylmuramoyl-L-alanine amidase [Bacteroidaceae bacterium]
MKRFLYALLCLILLCAATVSTQAQKAKNRPFTLVIDAGHGGKDPGAIGRRGTKEKHINLSVAKLFGKAVANKYPEIKIIYTRSKDVFIPLNQRAKIANQAKADLFISIHTNASKNRSARGCETFTLGAGSSAEALAAAKYENEVILKEENFEATYNGFNPSSTESYIIFELLRGHDMEKSVSCAEHIQNRMVMRSKLPNRGVSSAGFLVLHQTAMPSILIELGFISNSAEEKLLASSNGQEKLVKGIFEGFCNYYEEYKKTKLDDKKESKPVINEVTEPVTNNESAEAPIITEEQTAPQNNITEKKSLPVFKVQILASDKKLKVGDSRFKGEKVDYYYENRMYKYTCGASTDRNEIERLRRRLAKKFKGAFVIAFINDKRVDINKITKKK